ncbi:MAG: chorismate mutase, partial [Asticcacaulis sp.]
VALAAMTPEPTGDDMTFWVSDSPASETQLTEALAQKGLAADWLCTAQGVKLFGLIGYVQEQDPRLTDTKLGRLSGIIGAAARL